MASEPKTASHVDALIAALRGVSVFEDLPDDQLRWFAERSTQSRVAPGDATVHEGEPADRLFVLLEGELHARKETGASDQPTFVMKAPAVTGVLPHSRMSLFPRTVRAVAPTWIAAFPKALFDDLLREIPELGPRLVSVMVDRAREVARNDQQHEKLLALGKLAAGLAHELNNPAAAAKRAIEELRSNLKSLIEANVRLDERPLSTEQRKYMACVERETLEACGVSISLGPLERSDREEAVTTWLEDHSVEQPWNLAPALVEMDWKADDLEDVAARFDRDDLACVFKRLAATVAVGRLAAEIENSVTRVSELVKSVKEYSYMDQSSEQEIDIHQGLESTLTMLSFRLRGITVKREFDRSLPKLVAHASALNQVWTNLIDNAVQAMSGKGTLTIRTCAEPGAIVVEVADSGPGIPPDIQARIFEPFFTTKGVGEGTGLGLDTVRRIAALHGGEVTFTSKPGDTRFRVRLPLRKPTSPASDPPRA
ncbi:MAG: ATP-binding protein [Bryobacteraceae bacterium]|nr:ATP-binding protein [Bryobacteraceae bacterium]